jgi:hypothetical protein
VVGDAEQVRELLVLEGRRIGVHLAAELLAAEQGLVQARGRGAREVLRHELRLAELGEALERQEDLGARAVHHRAQDAEVLFQQAAVQHVAGARDLGKVDLREGIGEGVGHGGKVGGRGTGRK